jgi:uncharacterized surface protein with fasciclin (FAS1) repeats
MKNNKIMLGIAAVAIVAVLLVAFNMMNNSTETNSDTAMNNDNTMMSEDDSQGVMVGGALMTPDKDIVDNAVGSQDHTTLVAAVQAAGLVETLKGSGPFTVFAPTNSAFEQLPANTVDTLLMPENKDDLTGVLTYHVVPGDYRSTDLTDGMTLTTVQGQQLTFTMKDGAWYVNDTAMIEIADVISSNGVTHVIDSVLVPTE